MAIFRPSCKNPALKAHPGNEGSTMNMLYPVFALIALTFGVAMRLGYLRYRAVRHQQVDASFYQAYIGEEPLALRITSRHLVNLLEFPILFYLACILAFVTGQQGLPLLSLAWTFVGLRLVHTLIHLGPNIVIWRFRLFVLGILVLATLWTLLFLGLLGQ
jgi:hypothetical protein